MTHIVIEISERIERVSVKGHTGFAQAGEDIVCAGVSSITFAAGMALQRYQIPVKIFQNEETTEFVIVPKWSQMSEEQKLRTETILHTLQWALEDLADSYREYVSIDILRRC